MSGATTFSGLVEELKEDAIELFHEGEDFLKRAEKVIVPVVESAVVAIFSNFKKIAMDLIVEVGETAVEGATGQEKHSTVVTKLWQEIQAAGHTVEDVGQSAVSGFVKDTYDAMAAALGGASKTS